MQNWKRQRFLFFSLMAAGIIAVIPAFSIGRQQDALAQEPSGVTLTARLGLDGLCKKDSWIPVRVTAENAGPNVSGQVQISYTNTSGEVAFGREILLPTTSRKEVILYFYLQGIISDLKATLIEEGKILAETKLSANCLSSDAMIFGVLSDNPSAYGLISEVEPIGGIIGISQLTIADLPDRVQGWTLDALLVADTDTGPMTEAQRDALDSWLAGGGTLLFVGGPRWQGAAAGLKGLLPVEPSSTQPSVDVSALAAYFLASPLTDGRATVSIGRLAPDATVLVAQDGIPLLAERRVGFGKVIYLAADPSLAPLSDWQDLPILYDHLLDARSVKPGWVGNSWDGYSANNALSTLDILDVPSSVYICGWLVFYVIVIGPLNFFILRRLKRRDLAWITIPALVLLFGGAAYFYGAVYRGQKPTLNRLALVQAWEGVPTSEARGLVGLYSPTRTTYTLQANDGFMALPFESDYDDWMILQDEETALLPDLRVEIGGVRSALVQGQLPALQIQDDLVIMLNDGLPDLTGTISNLSPYTLRDAILVTSGHWQSLGDLPSGATVDARVKIYTFNATGPEFYLLDANGIFNLPNLPKQADLDAFRREAFFNAVINSPFQFSRSNGGNWGVYLMGWLDEPLLPVGLDGRAFDSVDTSLYVMSLNPTIKSGTGPIKLTNSLFAWETSSQNTTPYGADIPSNGYILRFRLAFPFSFKSVERLTLTLRAGTQNSTSNIPVTDVTVWIQDVTSREWEKVALSHWGDTDIPNPSAYVAPGGEVTIRITSPTQNNVQVTTSTITLTVNP